MEITPVGHEDIDWTFAACADRAIDNDGHDLFFKEDYEQAARYAQREQRAKALCRSCSILYECREYGLLNEIHGVWGGMSETERAAWRKSMDYRIPKT